VHRLGRDENVASAGEMLVKRFVRVQNELAHVGAWHVAASAVPWAACRYAAVSISASTDDQPGNTNGHKE
jgi:hypothetical protein